MTFLYFPSSSLPRPIFSKTSAKNTTRLTFCPMPSGLTLQGRTSIVVNTARYAMIDSYSFGSVTVNGKSYNSDVIIYPGRVNASWWRKQGHNLCIEDLEEVLRYKPEVLVVGQGKPGLMKVKAALVERLRREGIEVIAAPTERAIRAYNELSLKKKVVAALHLSC